MKKRIECRIFGRVQLVMFRDFATRKAHNLGIVGEVENKVDGTVALIGEGEEEKLLALIEKLKKGPLLARVEHIDVDWKEPTGAFQDFTIRY